MSAQDQKVETRNVRFFQATVLRVMNIQIQKEEENWRKIIETNSELGKCLDFCVWVRYVAHINYLKAHYANTKC